MAVLRKTFIVLTYFLIQT